MGNRARLRITGLAELRHAIKQYGNDLVQEALKAVKEATEQTVADARAAAPVKSGKLRDSIVGSVKTDGYSVTGRVRAKAPHAHLVELGTVRSKKKPFLAPAAIRHRKALNEAMAAAVKKHAPAALGTPQISGEGPGTPKVSIE